MRFPLPDHPSRLRKVLLAPATLLYATGVALHRALWLRPARHQDPQAIPVIVIGSLRAGGAGKTPVVHALAQHLTTAGYRVGVLTYRIGVTEKPKPHGDSGGEPSPPTPLPEGEGRSIIRHVSGCIEVFPDSDWRASSDEAVLLARALKGTGARVCATRDRALARAALGKAGRDARPEVLICDDGLMDPRLTRSPRVLRVALVRPGESPGCWDLLPAGPYRMTATALKDVDVVLREGDGFSRTPQIPLPLTRLIEQSTPVWVLTGLGHPQAFTRSLVRLGVRIAGVSQGPDHGLPNLTKARHAAGRAGIDHFVCSPKDWVKLETHPHRPEHLISAPESVHLSDDFLGLVRTFLTPSPS
jgi:tetraacyldisaccharide 4'-kinase